MMPLNGLILILALDGVGPPCKPCLFVEELFACVQAIIVFSIFHIVNVLV